MPVRTATTEHPSAGHACPTRPSLRERVRIRCSGLAELLASTPVTRTPARWERRPEIAPGDEVCLFLTYAAGGRIPEHSLHHARAWADAGFRMVIVATIDDMAAWRPPEDLAFAAGLFVRRNEGYDFGGWAAAIRGLPALRGAGRLAIVNDSIYGPLASFPAFLARVRASRADFIGAIESFEVRRHFQSFLLVFGARALASDAFWRFWRRVRNGSRWLVIDRYETKLLDRMAAAGLTDEALFPAPAGKAANTTLDDSWRDLIRDGFPFVKIRLLRENPCGADLTGWREVLGDAGFDTALIERHLGPRTPA